jgi:hypothetical protein
MIGNVDWKHGAEHMFLRHGITTTEADEAIADEAALLIDPDPRGRSGRSARLIGYSHTVQAILTIIRVHTEDNRGWYGANGWKSNPTDQRTYEQEA